MSPYTQIRSSSIYVRAVHWIDHGAFRTVVTGAMGPALVQGEALGWAGRGEKVGTPKLDVL